MNLYARHCGSGLWKNTVKKIYNLVWKKKHEQHTIKNQINKTINVLNCVLQNISENGGVKPLKTLFSIKTMRKLPKILKN